jgi:trk system potassium uptake protein
LTSGRLRPFGSESAHNKQARQYGHTLALLRAAGREPRPQLNAFARLTLPVLNVLGYVVLIFAGTMLVPLTFAFVGNDAALADYDIALIATAASGALLALTTRRYRRELRPRDGFLLVTLVWTVLPAFAALPLLLHIPGLDVSGAYFEAMSAMTTTGATVLTGLDGLPLSINVWRTMLQWLGGMGIIVLVVAILPLLGAGGAQLFRAETAGPIKDAKLTPRIADTAKALWSIYLVVSVACVVAYRWAGMSWVDALMHMFSTMSLGGFSSHDASFGHFDSPTIEYVAVVFMLIAGFNFSMHFVAWRGKSLQGYWRDPESMAYFFGLLSAVAAVTIFLTLTRTYDDWASSFRYALFNTVSAATTTGYASTDYAAWPIFAPIFLIFLSGFTTCAGSTGGGIKMVRGLVLLKQARRELTRATHPRAVCPVMLGGQAVDSPVIFAVLAFMLVYGATTVLLTLVLLVTGMELITAFSAVVACINNLGPGLGEVGPAGNFAGLNALQKWVCAFAMLVGRLELFTVLVILTPAFWRR